MKRRHFIPDTNVMMNVEINDFMFDIRPYTVVILKPVIIELDSLKRGKDERNKKARDAIKALERLQIGEIHLHSFEQYYDSDSPFLNQAVPFAHLVFSDSRAKSSVSNFDEEIILLAEQYAQKNKDVDVVLLTGDTTMRILARSRTPPFEVSGIRHYVADITADDVFYEYDVHTLSRLNEPLKEAYERRKKLRDEIASLPDDEVTENMKDELSEAETLEKDELERVVQARESRINARELDELKEYEVQEKAAREEREALELKERRRAHKRQTVGIIIIIILIAFSCISAYHFFTSSSLWDVFGF